MPEARTANPERPDNSGMQDVAALCGLDGNSRFAPTLEQVRQVLVDARGLVASGRYHRDLLLVALANADPTGGLRAHYARRLLCRLARTPSLPAWLDEPFTTRGEVLRLLVRAARAFGGAGQRRGGWTVRSVA